ncbi:hypothetical protein Bca4012_075445 [Brassica carinata]
MMMRKPFDPYGLGFTRHLATYYGILPYSCNKVEGPINRSDRTRPKTHVNLLPSLKTLIVAVLLLRLLHRRSSDRLVFLFS